MSIVVCDILFTMKFLWLAILIFIPKQVSAASEFTSSFESVYTIQESGQTNVSHTIVLKNNLSHIYATEYTIAISGNNLTNISASDESGPITTETSILNGINSIHMFISRPSIGLNQLKTIKLNYIADDVVETIGQSKTVNIPRLQKANESESYKRIVKIRGVEEMPAYIYPQASSKDISDGYSTYYFEGHQNDSLTLLFGESVTYELDLIYELKNNDLRSIDTEIALPSDTSYQKILLDQIDPKPKNIRVDADGNWLAQFTLDAQSKKIVKTKLYVTIYPIPKLKDPSSTNFVSTQKSKYWQQNTNILDLGSKLKTPENTYKYLVESFSYNYNANTTSNRRLGASMALESPSNVLCTEYTDSFIALMRTQNVPTREINGYAYTKNSVLQPQGTTFDILHAWPEYYNADQNAWISIDPTWGSTTGGIDYFNKLDFSHIAFVRRGIEDDYPLPAGSYKTSVSDKHINIKVASSTPSPDTTTKVIENTLYNQGNVAVYDNTVGYLPPYGSAKIQNSKHETLYDKIKKICAKLLSIF